MPHAILLEMIMELMFVCLLKENETAKGELLTSIQYLPGSERINISVMKARGLQLEDFDKGKTKHLNAGKQP